ncbi:zinc finger, C2H2-type, Ino80 complex subunit Iec1 [Pseudohyphozyma bogoriensis]|nr:zinc finger, C2H2-type, Ino80 complex subunit Iec1 [Pseudohyphozyma bogoriensis]
MNPQHLAMLQGMDAASTLSRSSSPLSSVGSSSPAPNTPPLPRSRSSSLSSTSSLEQLTGGVGDKYGFDPASLQTTTCQWNDCGAEFWEVEPMIEHIHAQCDKSFTRTDALQKHMRIQHSESLPPTRKPPTKNPNKKKTRAGSFDSTVDDDGGTQVGEDEDVPIVWSEEELELFERHPESDRFFLAYVLAKAKVAYSLGEHEGLVNELEGLGWREAELAAECDSLLERIMAKEVGEDPNDPLNGQHLRTFLKNYDHRPSTMPENGP